MTLRHKLADWISGGELTEARDRTHDWYLAWDEERRRANFASGELRDVRIDRDALLIDNDNGWSNSRRYAGALGRIIAEEKTTSNATVRRMARIAREALK